MSRFILSIFLVFILTNCHHTKVRFDSGDAPTPTNVKEIKDSLLYFGLSTKGKFWHKDARTKVLDLNSECPNGAYEVDHFITFWQSVLAQATFGIYIPYTIKITCR
jgi:hypothetical protein